MKILDGSYMCDIPMYLYTYLEIRLKRYRQYFVTQSAEKNKSTNWALTQSWKKSHDLQI